MPAPPARRTPGARRARRPDDASQRQALAAALDVLAAAVDAAQGHLRSAAPATHALIDERGFWPANSIWTDGTEVGEAARLLSALLRGHPDPPAAAAPARRSRRGTTRER